MPPTDGIPITLLLDYHWYKCKRCGESGFGKEPFVEHGGVENFLKDNEKFFRHIPPMIAKQYKRRFYE